MPTLLATAFGALLIFVSAASSTGSWAAEGEAETPEQIATQAPTQDQELERRLQVQTTYTTHAGDTWMSMAYLLYGHKTWWSKIKAYNEADPSLASIGPLDSMPAGKKIKYWSPQVGESYTVQPNDWLIRIVEWKYGARDLWEEVYRRNAQRISNPNLIHPGDQLTLKDDGKVANESTGEVLVDTQQPVGGDTTTVLTPPDGALAPVGYSDVTTAPPTPPQEESWLRTFGLGFALGGLALLLVPVLWWLKRPTRGISASQIDSKYLREKEKEQEAKRRAAVVRAIHGEKKGYPYAFESRGATQYKLDKSWIGRERPEVNFRPGYHTLRAKRSKAESAQNTNPFGKLMKKVGL